MSAQDGACVSLDAAPEAFGGGGGTQVASKAVHPVFLGSSIGPLTFGETLIWYDGPIVFTADGHASRWLAVICDDDRDAKTFDHVLFRLDEAEHAYLTSEGEGEGGECRFNDVSRRSLAREGGAHWIRCDWTNWRVLDERRIDPVEAADLAVGDDGPGELTLPEVSA